AFLFFLKLCVSRSHGVGFDSLSDCKFLLRHPAVRSLAVERGAGDRSVNGPHGAQWGHRPVRTEGQPHAVVEKSAKRIGALDAVWTDSLLRPAAVVDRVIGLHGSDDAQPRVADKILGGHVLRVLDAPAAVALAAGFFNLLKDIENHGNGV